MALLPTGSDKILEINTAEVNIVIKVKRTGRGKCLTSLLLLLLTAMISKELILKRLVFAKNLMIAQMQQFTI